jgi:hypothetical protein
MQDYVFGIMLKQHPNSMPSNRHFEMELARHANELSKVELLEDRRKMQSWKLIKRVGAGQCKKFAPEILHR